MKEKYILIIVLLSLTVNSYGQDTKQVKNEIKLNIGFQWNLPEKYFNKNLSQFNQENSGGGIHLYPKWHHGEYLSLGLNIEFAIVQEKATTDNIHTFNIFSFSPTINYYFTKNKIRPYAGLGIGFYNVFIADTKLNFGVRPIVGVSVFNKFDFSFEYSRIFGLEIDSKVSKGFGNYYFALKGSCRVGNYGFKFLKKK